MAGNISKRRDNVWQIRIERERGPDGKRRYFYDTCYGSFKDAQKHKSRLLVANDSGTLADPDKATVGSYLATWLDGAHDLSPKTLERYRELAKHQIVPHLGSIALQKLTPERIRMWHAALLEKVSAQTVKHAHRLLQRALAFAVENGRLVRNPAAKMRLPRVDAPEIEILSQEQIADMLTKLSDHPLFPLWATAIGTGARRGELLALCWGDVHLDVKEPFIRIERSLEETRTNGNGNSLRLKSPKTKTGKRNIGIAPETVAVLRAHKIEVLQRRMVLKQGKIDDKDTPVFGTLEATFFVPNSITRSWHRALESRGLPKVSFHALRHSHVSALIRAGVDILSISRRIGHAKPSMTLDRYGHLLPCSDAACVAAISDALRG
jgi:integrase